MFLTAFAIGALGSFHCIGMCGPIALSIPLAGRNGVAGILRGLAYNAGRILTYSILGLLVGSLGQQIAFGGFQQALSITVGVLILSVLILPGKITKRIDPTSRAATISIKLKSIFQSAFKRKDLLGPLSVGLMNGLLPCGLVYVGLAGALALGNPLDSARFMAFFGLGTVPMMLAVFFVGDLISIQWRSNIRKLMPVMFAVMGVLFILRGLNLGIPYVSPILDATSGSIQECVKP